jgi:hypothetical protein
MDRSDKDRVLPILTIAAVGIGGLLWLHLISFPLCDVARYPELFTGRSVSVSGTLYGYSAGVIHLAGTGCEDSDAWATVELSDSIETDTRADRLLNSIHELPDRSQYVKAEVVVTGRLEDLHRTCFGPRFIITAESLEQMSPASLLRTPD